jgi:hypothetical protein
VIYVDLPCFVQEEAQLSRAYWCLDFLPLLKVLTKHRKNYVNLCDSEELFELRIYIAIVYELIL